MKHKSALMAAALAVGVAAPVAVVGPAQAEPAALAAADTVRAPRITSVKVSNVTVTASNRPRATLTVKVSDPSNTMRKSDWTYYSWDADAEPALKSAYGWEYFTSFKRTRNTSNTDTWTARSTVFRYDDWGKYTTEVNLDGLDYSGNRDIDYDITRFATSYVRGNVGLTFNASPEPVRKGGAVTVKGKVTRLNETTYRYRKAGKGTRVRIYFAPGKSGGVKQYRGTALVGSTGTYSKRFKATSSGRWYAVVSATTRYIQRTRVDYVAVRR